MTNGVRRVVCAHANYDTWINTQLNDANEAATAEAKHDGRGAGRAVVLDDLRLLSDALVEGSGDQRAMNVYRSTPIATMASCYLLGFERDPPCVPMRKLNRAKFTMLGQVLPFQIV